MTTNRPTRNLEELKRQLEKARPVEVDQQGQLSVPNDENNAKVPSEEKKTTVKPTRWYFSGDRLPPAAKRFLSYPFNSSKRLS
jgi:hypothetical protein